MIKTFEDHQSICSVDGDVIVFVQLKKNLKEVLAKNAVPTISKSTLNLSRYFTSSLPEFIVQQKTYKGIFPREGNLKPSITEKDEIYSNKGGINMPLPIASMHKLIRKAGAHRVSQGAAKELALYLEEVAAEVAGEALKLAEHAGRKTVRIEDIELAKKSPHFRHCDDF